MRFTLLIGGAVLLSFSPWSVSQGVARAQTQANPTNDEQKELPSGAAIRLGANLLRKYKSEFGTISPDGKFIALAEPLTIDVVDVATGRTRYSVPAKSSFVSYQFSDDGKTFVVGTEGSVETRDLATGKPMTRASIPKMNHFFLLSSDGSRVCMPAGLRPAPPVVNDVATGQEIIRAKNDLIVGAPIAFAANGRRFAFMVNVRHPGRILPTQSIEIWDVDESRLARSIDLSYSPDQLALTSDGKRLAILDGRGIVEFYDAETGNCELRFAARQYGRGPLKFSNDGKQLAHATQEGHCLIWELKSPLTKVRRTDIACDKLFGIRFSPKGALLAWGIRDKTHRVWDVESGASLTSAGSHAKPPTTLQFSSDST